MSWVHKLRLSAVCLGASAVLMAAGDRPAVGSFGFDLAGMDRSIAPGNDFNGFANGKWAATTTIPGDHAFWGVWDVLEDKARADTRAILEAAAAASAPAGSNAQKIGDFYASFMDVAAIDAKGADPLASELAAIAAIGDYHQLAAAMGAAQRDQDGAGMPVAAGVDVDPGDPSAYIAYIAQDGLGLPDRDYYLKDEPEFLKARAAYTAYAAKLLLLARVAHDQSEADTRVAAVFALEHRLAEVQWERAKLRDPVANYKPWARAEFAVKAPGFDWNAYLTAARLDGPARINAYTDAPIVATAKLVETVPLPVWRDYMAIRAIDAHARFLATPFADAWFGFHETVLSGTPEQPLRWKRGVDRTSRVLGEAIGQLYVKEHFTPDTKAAAETLVRNLLAAMGRHIDALTWMTPATKAQARAKLATFEPKIGYPTRWRDYSAYRVVRGDAYGNALRGDRYLYDRDIAKLGKPIDRTEWNMAPMTINAYYNPLKNEIVFPAAVLQPPFFDAHADPAVNYGGIGAIIGHEISHGFDDQGRQFDATGKLRDWWTAADADAFKTRAAALVQQYGAYETLPGLHLNGQLTLGENIADTAGLTIAYDAYRHTLGDTPAPVIDGFTGDQRFFLGFAQVWRTVARDSALRQAQAVDPHSPDRIRTRTVRNFDPWYAAFAVKPDETLYLTPDARVRIW